MNFRGQALAAFFILNWWSSQNVGPGLGLGPGQALAGLAKIEGLGKVKYEGSEFFRAPNGKHSGHLNRTGWPGSGSIQVRSLLGQTAAQEVPR